MSRTKFNVMYHLEHCSARASARPFRESYVNPGHWLTEPVVKRLDDLKEELEDADLFIMNCHLVIAEKRLEELAMFAKWGKATAAELDKARVEVSALRELIARMEAWSLRT